MCLNLGREGTVPSSQVSRCYWAEEKDNRGFFFSFLLSLFPFLFSLSGHGDSMAILSLSVAFIDRTARVLLVELGDEGKPRPFYRWLFSTLGNGDISLYQWLSDTFYTGYCCGWAESKGKDACMSLDSSSWMLINRLICFDIFFSGIDQDAWFMYIFSLC